MTTALDIKKSYIITGAIILAAASILMPDLANAQQLVQGYSYQERQAISASGNNLIFGVAIDKICTVKNAVFMGVYVLAAIAFVIFAIRALFTKFEFKSFFPILGAIFVVAFADLFIAFIAPNAYYCPTVLSQI